MKSKTFFGKIIAFLGHLFAGLFHVARQVYDSLPQDVKDALLHGTGVIEIINGMLDKSPSEIRAAIAAKYPNLNEPQIEAALISVLHTFNIIPKINNLEEAIQCLKDYLSTHNGGAWAKVSHAVSVGLSYAFAPKGTKLAVITSTIEAVYQSEHK